MLTNVKLETHLQKLNLKSDNDLPVEIRYIIYKYERRKDIEIYKVILPSVPTIFIFTLKNGMFRLIINTYFIRVG